MSHKSQIVRYLIYLLSLSFFYCFANDPKASGTKDAKTPESPPPTSTKPPEMYPRKVTLPKQIVSNFDVNFSLGRFTLLVLVGTWNPKSREMMEWLNKNIQFFQQRGVQLILVFSSDTQSSIKDWEKKYTIDWKKKYNLTYSVGSAHSKFIEELHNPRVPSLWILNPNRQILMHVEVPTDKELSEITNKLSIWTDF